MKELSCELFVPYFFAMKDKEVMAVPSFVGTTMITCFLITQIPALMPLWMLLATSKVPNIDKA